MRLTNLLKQPGGVSEQGREVTLRLRYAGPGGVPEVRDVLGVMLPVSEVEHAQLTALAQSTVDLGGSLRGGAEYVVRLLQASLRDPSDLSKHLIEDEADLNAVRKGLVGPQYRRMVDEYRALIEAEYPGLVTEEDVAGLEREAQDFSEGGQPSPG